MEKAKLGPVRYLSGCFMPVLISLSAYIPKNNELFFTLNNIVNVFLVWHKEQFPRSGSQSRPTRFIKDSLLFMEQFPKNLAALAEVCSFEVGDTKCTIVVLF